MSFHLAQVNIARARAEMTSDIMASFAARLDEINALAERHPGFVWRLQDETGDATSIQAFDDPLVLVNLSVWQDLDSLKQFVYRSNHVELIRDRDAWFHKLPEMHQALWWVPAGHRPSVAEAKERLAAIRAHGPSPMAFSFAKPFAAPTVTDV